MAKMARIVPFFAADQPLVNELCEIIFKLYNETEKGIDDLDCLTEKEDDLLYRIIGTYTEED